MPHFADQRWEQSQHSGNFSTADDEFGNVTWSFVHPLGINSEQAA